MVEDVDLFRIGGDADSGLRIFFHWEFGLDNHGLAGRRSEMDVRDIAKMFDQFHFVTVSRKIERKMLRADAHGDDAVACSAAQGYAVMLMVMGGM